MKKTNRTVITFSLLAIFMLTTELLEFFLNAKDYYPKEKAKIHLYGETHGEPKFYQKELEEWGKFYSEGVRDLFIEIPYYTAQYLNLWMHAEDDVILNQYYDDLEGTLSHTEEFRDFWRSFKNQYPETVFYGTDVGHQYFSIGKRYLEYLETDGLKDTKEYELAEKCIEQGKIYYDNTDYANAELYREQKLVENFIAVYDSLGQKEIAGIYGSNHTNMKYKSRMASQIKSQYGDIVESKAVYNMLMHKNKHFSFGFCYVGLIFLLMLFIPNIVWTKFKPSGYDNYVKNENKILCLLEKIGEAGATVMLLFFTDCNFEYIEGKSKIICSFLDFHIILAFILMVFYEIYWIRYFKSSRTMKDFYSSIIGIPLAGAVIPVISLFILGVYSRNIAILITSVVLGTGHIGIHYGHYNEIKYD